MAGKEVIRAAQMFTTNGMASKVSVVKEIVIGSALGLGFGLWWQVRRVTAPIAYDFDYLCTACDIVNPRGSRAELQVSFFFFFLISSSLLWFFCRHTTGLRMLNGKSFTRISSRNKRLRVHSDHLYDFVPIVL